MNCEIARSHLQEDLDGEIRESTRSSLGEHLLRCNTCRDYRDQLRTLATMLEEIGRSDRTVPERAPQVHSIRRWPIAAAAALVIGISLWMLMHRSDSDSTEKVLVGSEPAPELSTSRIAQVVPVDKDSVLVRPMTSQHSDIHIVWLYETGRDNSQQPGENK